jgi:hypothetical protein
MSAQLEEARRQRRLGRFCVRLKPKTKAPIGNAWQKLRLDEQELARDFRDKEYNVGLLLGIDPERLVQVDLDCIEAYALADAFLPATGLESGHGQTQRAGRFYSVDDLDCSKPFVDPLPDSEGKKPMLIEFRGTGLQAAIATSIHPNGDTYAWVNPDGGPAKSTQAKLMRATARTAAAALIARRWNSDGKRHDVGMALVGTLKHGGFEEHEIRELLLPITEYLYSVTSDEYRDAHTVKALDEWIAAATKRDEEKGKLWGFPTLAGLIGRDSAEAIHAWLGLKSTKQKERERRLLYEEEEAAELGEALKSGRARLLREMAEIETLPIEWLWDFRIAKAMMNAVVGFPDIGKSTLIRDLVSRVTRGAKFPDGAVCEKQGVLMINNEEAPEYIIKPGLIAAGADTSMVTFTSGSVEIINDPDARCYELTFPYSVKFLEQEIRDRKIGLVTIDVLSAMLAGHVDPHKSSNVRRALTPVARMAARTGCAVLFIEHPNKQSSEKDFLLRVSGSIATMALVRMAWAVGFDPTDERPVHERRRVMAPLKNNLSSGVVGARGFYISDSDDDTKLSGHPVIKWEKGEDLPLRANDLLASPKQQPINKKGAGPERSRAADMLDAAFKNRKEVPVSELRETAERLEINWKSVQRAMKDEYQTEEPQGRGKPRYVRRLDPKPGEI